MNRSHSLASIQSLILTCALSVLSACGDESIRGEADSPLRNKVELPRQIEAEMPQLSEAEFSRQFEFETPRISEAETPSQISLQVALQGHSIKGGQRPMTKWPSGQPMVLPDLDALHRSFAEEFVRAPGFGTGRLPTLRVLLSQLVEHNGALFEVEEVRLMGLLNQREPQVYLVGAPFAMEESLDWPSRDLDAFETEGLRWLRSGRKSDFESQSGGGRLLAGVYAQADCLKCHDAEVGDLLGALVYDLTSLSPTE